jgi:predicted lipoprotein with Yx(FWY)xxD motif
MIRNRIALLLLLAALTAVSFASAAGASAATVELRNTALGEILVGSNGFTLFEFSIDPKKMDHCVTIMGCPGTWPPLTVTETPTAGPGLKPKKLRTITLPGGAKQVTYNNRPLYGYSGNVGPGETSYVGVFEFGGYWFAMNAKGKPVR